MHLTVNCAYFFNVVFFVTKHHQTETNLLLLGLTELDASSCNDEKYY